MCVTTILIEQARMSVDDDIKLTLRVAKILKNHKKRQKSGPRGVRSKHVI